MSTVSSLTGLSSASSFITFHRAAWCTPPRLLVEDQYDVVPPDTVSVSSLGKRSTAEEPIKKKNQVAVKISPWTLTRLNAEDVSKAAAEARKKSKILQPVVRNKEPYILETTSSLRSSGRRMVPRPDNNKLNKQAVTVMKLLDGENCEVSASTAYLLRPSNCWALDFPFVPFIGFQVIVTGSE